MNHIVTNNNGIKVSIIIPVFNVSSYIERCINSVLQQTYSNIECIIVDDATPDDSIEKCEGIIKKYNKTNFKILHHDHNRGLSAARNTGTFAATGDYLFYLDSDDEISHDCISLLIEAVKKHPEIELVQGGIKSVPHVSFYDFNFLKDVTFVDDNIWIRKHFYCFENKLSVNAWNKLIKKTFITENSLYFKEGLIHEDELWMFFLVKKLKTISIIHNKTYIHYVGTVGSIMSTNTQKRAAQHYAIILRNVLENLDNPCFNEQLLSYGQLLFLFYGISDEYNILFKLYISLLRKSNYIFVYLFIICLKKIYDVIKLSFIKRLIIISLRMAFDRI